MIILAEIVLRNKNDIAQDNWISYFIVIIRKLSTYFCTKENHYCYRNEKIE